MNELQVLEVMQAGVLGVLGFLWSDMRKYREAYATAKGTNLATKEDIEQITHKIESVKADLNLKAELRRQVAIVKVQVVGQIMAMAAQVARRAEAFGTDEYVAEATAFARLLVESKYLFSMRAANEFEEFLAKVVIHGHRVKSEPDVSAVHKEFAATRDQLIALVRSELHIDDE